MELILQIWFRVLPPAKNLFFFFSFLFLSFNAHCQVSKEKLLSNPNHIGGSQTNTEEFNVIIANKDIYTHEEVNNAYLNKESSMFRADPDSLMTLFEEHLDYLNKIGKTEWVGEALLSQAELLYMVGNMNEALDRIKAGIRVLPDNSNYKRMAYARLGSVYLQVGELDSSDLNIRKFADGVFGLKDTTMFLTAYQLMGEHAIATNKYVTGLAHYMKALDWADRAVIPLQKSDVLQKIASIYVALNDDTNAKKYLEQALQIAVENSYMSMQNNLKTRLAHYELREGNFNTTEEYLLTAEKYFLEKKRFKNVLECRTTLVQLYLENGQKELAKIYLNQARNVIDKIETERYKYFFYQVSGMLMLKENKLDEAEAYFLKAAELASNPLKSNLYQSSLEKLIELYKRRGDLRSELFFTNKYHNFKDSIFTIKQSQLIYDYEGRYQKAEQDLAIAKLNKTNAANELQLTKKNRQLWLSLLGIAAILSLALISIWAYLQKKRSADELSKKNKIIEKSLYANKMLLKEIHHRVKNNLQVVSSLLYLQSRFIKDDSAKGALNTGRARVQAMSILHQKLYKHDDIQKVDISEYFKDLGHNLFSTYKIKDRSIEFKTSLDNIALDVDTVIPMGLIANELISNALKHAFENRDKGIIQLSIHRNKNVVTMVVEDNGIGLPFESFPEKTDSLGVELIKSFASKLEADISISNEGGTKTQLDFEVPEDKNREVLVFTDSRAS